MKSVSAGVRAIYVVKDEVLELRVIAVGARDKGAVYEAAARWMAANWPPLG